MKRKHYVKLDAEKVSKVNDMNTFLRSVRHRNRLKKIWIHW